jgi:hypothetical protein
MIAYLIIHSSLLLYQLLSLLEGSENILIEKLIFEFFVRRLNIAVFPRTYFISLLFSSKDV